MTTTPLPTHTAVFVRSTNAHYHQGCLPTDQRPSNNYLQLDMNDRNNIAQCLHVGCDGCGEALYLFPDRKQIVLAQWPGATIKNIEDVNGVASRSIGMAVTLDEADKNYRILHAWVLPPFAKESGQIVALCELIEEPEEERPTPSSQPLAREAFTPPIWTIKHVGGRCYSFHSPARDNYMVAMAFSEADARLIAEAPNMFALLKEFVKQHAMSTIEGEPNCEEWPCADCVAARRLIARVLGEEK